MYEPDGEGDFRLRPGVHETPSPEWAEVEKMLAEGSLHQMTEQEVEEFFKSIRAKS